MTAPKRTAHQMHEMLAKHYAPPPSKPPGGRIIKEIQAPQSTRQADALYLPTTSAERGRIIGHEIKVSRSDLIQELRDPHKADAWKRYCSRWWLVISDAAFLEGLDIPDDWGILTPPSRENTRFMTVVRKAPLLTPNGDMAAAWGTIFAKTAYADMAHEGELLHLRRQERNLIEQSTELMREVAQLKQAEGIESPYRTSRIKIAEVIAAIEKMGGYEPGTVFRGMSWQIDSEKVARGILAAAKLDDGRDIADEVQIAVERAERAARELRAVHTALTIQEGS